MDVLLEILEWVNRKSAPNESYRYSRCVICGHAWWDNYEEHNFDCWVPRVKKAAQQHGQAEAEHIHEKDVICPKCHGISREQDFLALPKP